MPAQESYGGYGPAPAPPKPPPPPPKPPRSPINTCCNWLMATFALFFVVYFGTLAAEETFLANHPLNVPKAGDTCTTNSDCYVSSGEITLFCEAGGVCQSCSKCTTQNSVDKNTCGMCDIVVEPTKRPTKAPTKAQSVPLGWCISGDGNRAMFSAVGYARAFYNGGILDDPSLQAVASNSGGTWFLSQFAFSESFFNSVTTGNLDDLVQQWMEAAGDFFTISCIDLKDFEKASSYGKVRKIRLTPCKTQVHVAKSFLIAAMSIASNATIMNPTKAAFKLDAAVSFVLMALRSEENWAEFIIKTLNTTTPDMADAIASPAARVGGLTRPWLHFQNTLAGSAFTNEGTISNYGSVDGTSGNGRTTPFASLPHQYIIPSLSSGKDTMEFTYPAIPSQMKLRPGFVYEAPNSTVGQAQRGSIVETIRTSTNSLGQRIDAQQSDPPKVTLLASISSAAAGIAGSPMGAVEAIRKVASKEDADGLMGVYTALSLTGTTPGNKYFNAFIKRSTNLAVCTSPVASNGVPEACTYPYQRMMDGAYVDNLATAQTVGKMQDRFPNQQLRLILVDASDVNKDGVGEYVDTEYLFANSPVTRGVKPGETQTAFVGITAPSCQAFAEDWDAVAKLYKPVGEGAGNITYAEVTTKTVENPAFGIRAGTIVNLLIFQLNNPMPMLLPYQDTDVLGKLSQWEIAKYQMVAQTAASPLVTKIASDWTAATKYAQ